ncbi:YEATS family protein [Reticulomyxa filosa]|uniref:YEATS family protein n=1 Tax=Reticulomyxa filosa TaxID=46433 RepID=X6NGR6_RETFI|nr:YEATS family protein [Reticulomyxa filosa]|eukprot:ETO25510.1 YEATS family protein [Reticulomyxa filosa]
MIDNKIPQLKGIWKCDNSRIAIEEMNNFIKEYKKKQKNAQRVIICGDFNLDVRTFEERIQDMEASSMWLASARGNHINYASYDVNVHLKENIAVAATTTHSHQSNRLAHFTTDWPFRNNEYRKLLPHEHEVEEDGHALKKPTLPFSIDSDGVNNNNNMNNINNSNANENDNNMLLPSSQKKKWSYFIQQKWDHLRLGHNDNSAYRPPSEQLLVTVEEEEEEEEKEEKDKERRTQERKKDPESVNASAINISNALLLSATGVSHEPIPPLDNEDDDDQKKNPEDDDDNDEKAKAGNSNDLQVSPLLQPKGKIVNLCYHIALCFARGGGLDFYLFILFIYFNQAESTPDAHFILSSLPASNTDHEYVKNGRHTSSLEHSQINDTNPNICINVEKIENPNSTPANANEKTNGKASNEREKKTEGTGKSPSKSILGGSLLTFTSPINFEEIRKKVARQMKIVPYMDIAAKLNAIKISTVDSTERTNFNLDHIFIDFKTSQKPICTIHAKRRGLSDHYLMYFFFLFCLLDCNTLYFLFSSNILSFSIIYEFCWLERFLSPCQKDSFWLSFSTFFSLLIDVLFFKKILFCFSKITYFGLFSCHGNIEITWILLQKCLRKRNGSGRKMNQILIKMYVLRNTEIKREKKQTWIPLN